MENNNNQTVQTTDPVVEDGAQNQQTDPAEEPTSTEKTFTQKELDSILEKRLAKERTKWEKKVKEEADEAARMAEMSEAERQQALFDKRVKDFEEREAAFNKAQEDLKREKMLNETSKQLAAKNLPLDFAEKLMADTAEDTLANIDAFEKEWQLAIDKAITNKLKGSTPTSPISKIKPEKSVSKMSFSEFAKHKKNED